MAAIKNTVLFTNSSAVPTGLIATPGYCDTGNSYDGNLGLRISSIFVILAGSFLGAWFPVFARRHTSIGIPELAFFVAKYFGSGVIIATAFIHLLASAHDALTNDCLTGPITDYCWVEGIILIVVMMLFFVELVAMRHSHAERCLREDDSETAHALGPAPGESSSYGHEHAECDETTSSAPGHDHLGHGREHTANEEFNADWQDRGLVPEAYAAQLTAIFVLEFGVIFHSVFIGLTLAVAGHEFNTLYVVLAFHQTFEGLDLGARLADFPWPKARRWTPYLFAIGYAVSTPVAIAVGLGIRAIYPPESATTLIVNGIFDSISAGILIYTGLVELMAHEFMFSPTMAKAPIKRVISAFALMCIGAALMALLGRWA